MPGMIDPQVSLAHHRHILATHRFISTARHCAQVGWLQTHILDYGAMYTYASALVGAEHVEAVEKSPLGKYLTLCGPRPNDDQEYFHANGALWATRLVGPDGLVTENPEMLNVLIAVWCNNPYAPTDLGDQAPKPCSYHCLAHEALLDRYEIAQAVRRLYRELHPTYAKDSDRMRKKMEELNKPASTLRNKRKRARKKLAKQIKKSHRRR